MAERKIVGRKSQMFLHSVIPVVKTHDEVVKEKLKSGKFPLTVTGILKIIGMLLLVLSFGIFLSNSTCPNTPQWFPYVLPGVVGSNVILSLLLYVTFSFGLIVSNPATWIKIDILTNLTLSISTIIVCIMSMMACNSLSSLIRIPMILGLSGGSILILSCAALFLLYRYKEDEEYEVREHNPTQIDPRKSIFA